MPQLSSNWKKLQATLKTDADSAQRTKRKAEDQLLPQTWKRKAAPAGSTRQTALTTKERPSSRNMGSVQSAMSVEVPKTGVSPCVALWTDKSDISTERLAEAYGLGARGKSMMNESEKDRVNHGLSAGIEIGKYVAIDCEMVGVGRDSRESVLARISMVDFHGNQVYDSFVRPKEPVTDWRTAVSGVSKKEMRFARDFEEVQKEVSEIFKGRILVGHDIKHDLDALKLSHLPRDIRDTAKFHGFKKYGNGPKPSLKTLTRELLGIEIQNGVHSSTEDARATMLLFRKFKSAFDVNHANRYKQKDLGTPKALKKGQKKTKKKGPK